MIVQSLLSSYLVRLVCFSLASFFLIHSAVSLAILLIGRQAINFAERRLQPRSAAQLMLALRLLPSALAFLAVAGLCVPSYVWLEPKNTHEQVDFWCWCAALLCVLSLGTSTKRVLRALLAAFRYTRECQRERRETIWRRESSPLWVIDSNLPVLALIGVRRLHTIISERVLRELSSEQLETALAHESAHRHSRDNLKRLLILLAADPLPFCRGFNRIERAWARFTEWAADDLAVAGDPARAVALASALIRVARMGLAEQPAGVPICFVSDGRDLSTRIDRLLHDNSIESRPQGRNKALLAVAAFATGVLAVIMSQPFTLYSVHRLLEHLVR